MIRHLLRCLWRRQLPSSSLLFLGAYVPLGVVLSPSVFLDLFLSCWRLFLDVSRFLVTHPFLRVRLLNWLRTRHESGYWLAGFVLGHAGVELALSRDFINARIQKALHRNHVFLQRTILQLAWGREDHVTALSPWIWNGNISMSSSIFISTIPFWNTENSGFQRHRRY